MNGKIAIIGKAASGKDFLKKKLTKQGISFGVSSTTRTPRDGEVHGIDYKFTNVNMFERHIALGTMVLYQKINGHYYGITEPEFNHSSAMILNVEVLRTMPQWMRDKLFVIFLDVPDDVRIQRLKQRGFTDEQIQQRIEADDKEYDGFEEYDMRITDPEF